jgi:hypothetical protein
MCDGYAARRPTLLQARGFIPAALLVVLVPFGPLVPRNSTTITKFLVCALSVSAEVFQGFKRRAHR